TVERRTLTTGDTSAMRAIDVHVHLHTTGADAARTDAQQVFGTSGDSVDLLEYYTSRDLGAVIFDVDKETTTGQRIDNGAVAQLAAKSGGRLIGFASVDPNKGTAAIEELERCAELG